MRRDDALVQSVLKCSLASHSLPIRELRLVIARSLYWAAEIEQTAGKPVVSMVDAVVGELWVDAREQEVELARLIVAPARRGRGGGVALVRLLLEEAGRTAYPRAFLRVFPDNRAAIACYLRAGFSRVSPAEQQAFNRSQTIEYLWMGCAPRQ